MRTIHYEDGFTVSWPMLCKSWCYISKSFAGDFDFLSGSGALKENSGSPEIWSTKQKFVLKVSVDGRSYAFKGYRKIRHVEKYLFRLSPCGFEARNYQLLGAAGLPMAKLAAAGDVRKNFLLKDMFLVTEFAENFRDGRDFQPGNMFCEDWDLKEEYIIRNMRLLAKCHDAGLVHGGFTPANLLYKVREMPDEQGNKLDLLWIDVATCRKFSLLYPPRKMITDHVHFFKFLDIRGEKLERYLRVYYDAVKIKRLSFDRLLKLLHRNTALFPGRER